MGSRLDQLAATRAVQVTAMVYVCLSSPLEEAAAGVRGIAVYFDNEFSMRLQTNKINSLGGMFNSQLYGGETSLVADG